MNQLRYRSWLDYDGRKVRACCEWWTCDADHKQADGPWEDEAGAVARLAGIREQILAVAAQVGATFSDEGAREKPNTGKGESI